MLNEVLRLTQGDLSGVVKDENTSFVPFDAYDPPLHLDHIRPFPQRHENGECKHGMQFSTECEECIKEQHAAFRGKHLERGQNNEAFYKDYQGENHA